MWLPVLIVDRWMSLMAAARQPPFSRELQHMPETAASQNGAYIARKQEFATAP
jgi:GAF domain-containing protein